MIGSAPRRARGTGLRETATAGETVLEIQPTPLPLAWRGLAWLLVLLFGLPALAILVSAGRWDAVSLPAAALGLGIAGWSLLVLRRAAAGRRPQRLQLGPDGLAWDGAALAWPEVRAFAVQPPAAPGGAQAPGASALAQRVAAERMAQEWQVTAGLADGRQLAVAAGLDQPTATRVRDRLEAMRAGATPG